MKKTILLLMSILLLSSCGGNDDVIQSGIVGKWNKTRETKEYQNGTFEEVSLSNCDLKQILELKSNGKVTLTNYLGTSCEEVKVSEGDYSFNESKNELTLPGNSKQIVEVNGNNMNFKFTIKGVENFHKTVYFRRVN